MYSIGQLAKQFNLSRSTLLYYESIGLLIASERVYANYRCYSEDDCRRLEQICMYRQAGLALKDIAKILQASPGATAAILAQRVKELNAEIVDLRGQQQFIISILQNVQLSHGYGPLDEESWIEILTNAGCTREDCWRWHQHFEQSSPEKHQKFLESLGFHPEEVKEVRARSLGPYDSRDS